jgi:hypothetical protein
MRGVILPRQTGTHCSGTISCTQDRFSSLAFS